MRYTSVYFWFITFDLFKNINLFLDFGSFIDSFLNRWYASVSKCVHISIFYYWVELALVSVYILINMCIEFLKLLWYTVVILTPTNTKLYKNVIGTSITFYGRSQDVLVLRCVFEGMVQFLTAVLKFHFCNKQLCGFCIDVSLPCIITIISFIWK